MDKIKTDIEQRQSKVFRIIRFPLIVLVVFIHGCPNAATLSSIINPVGAKLYCLASELIRADLGSFAVPCFFVMSGYYFFYMKKDIDMHFYKVQLTKRIKTLLIPYLIWNLIFILIPIVRYYIFVHYGKGYDENYYLVQHHSFFSLIWSVYNDQYLTPIDIPLWYVRDLMCMVILSPVFYYFIKYTKVYGLVALTILYLSGLNTNIPGFDVVSFLSFGAGAFCALRNINIVELLSKYKSFAYASSILLLVVIACLRYMDSQFIGYFIRLFSIVGIVAMVNLMNSLIEKEKLTAKLTSLSSAVFFIYAVHYNYIVGFVRKLYSLTFLSKSWSVLFISYVLISLTCVLVCYGLYLLVKRFAPKVLSVLAGGRY